MVSPWTERTRGQAPARPTRFFRSVQPPAWSTKGGRIPSAASRSGRERRGTEERRVDAVGDGHGRGHAQLRPDLVGRELRGADHHRCPAGAGGGVGRGHGLVGEAPGHHVVDGQDLGAGCGGQPEVEPVDDVVAPVEDACRRRDGAGGRHRPASREGMRTVPGSGDRSVRTVTWSTTHWSPSSLGGPTGQLVLVHLLAHGLADRHGGQCQARAHRQRARLPAPGAWIGSKAAGGRGAGMGHVIAYTSRHRLPTGPGPCNTMPPVDLADARPSPPVMPRMLSTRGEEASVVPR